jgi:hypothetical protein
VVAGQVVARLYSMALLLRCCGYFNRLHQATRDLARSSLRDLRDAAATSPSTSAHTAECLHFVLQTYSCGRGASENIDNVGSLHSSTLSGTWDVDREVSALCPEDLLDDAKCRALLAQPGRRSASRQVLAWIRRFLTLSNGPLWREDVQHHCSGVGCAACGGHVEEAQQEFALLLRQLLLRKLPCVPVASRWTRVFPAIAFTVSGILLHGALPALFSRAFANFNYEAMDDLTKELDPAMQEEVSYHKVNSSRAKHTEAFLLEKDSQIRLVIFALFLEPLQWLTGILMMHSREIVDYDKPPFLLDALHLPSSPFLVKGPRDTEPLPWGYDTRALPCRLGVRRVAKPLPRGRNAQWIFLARHA